MFWKRPVNINFITMLTVVLLLFVVAGFCGKAGYDYQDVASQAHGDAADILENGVDTVSGWGVIFGELGAGTMMLASGIMFLVMFTLLVFAFAILVPLVIARCVYKNHGGRLLAYRILMGVVCAVMGILIISIFSFFTSSPSVLLLFILFVLSGITVWNMVNTYSARIRRY